MGEGGGGSFGGFFFLKEKKNGEGAVRNVYATLLGHARILCLLFLFSLSLFHLAI